MISISAEGIVTVNRGDSFNLPISLNISSGLNVVNYQLTESDTIHIAVMEPNQTFESAIIHKTLTFADVDSMKNISVQFWTEDTEHLYPGKYYYQVKVENLTTNPETQVVQRFVTTIVDKTILFIKE